jgi:beta-lactamase regulating signal transducer with metallopeptidase domain
MFESANLLAWMEQALLVALAGSLSLRVLRVRQPRTQLAFCHALLAICLLLPFLQPWRHPVMDVSGASTVPPTPQTPAMPQIPWTRVALWTLIAGVAVKLCWLLGGLWRIRRYRIGAMPLYPIPESVQAAAAITHANAVFCISADVPGPVMLGWLAPVVLLPDSFLALGEEAQCGIACHELLHVRRHDWLSTLIEELAGALLWFNPAIWLLLAQTRLVREQLVDAEVVRLTASREPYIDALLAIARGGPVPNLGMDLSMDPTPAPLFLRRRHLTQRMHSLLQDASISRLRLVSSYASIAAVLVFAGWFGMVTFPLTGSPQFREVAKPAPVAAAPIAPPPPAIVQAQIEPTDTSADIALVPLPPDPHELVTGAVRAVATPADRAAALSLLDRARQNGNSHAAGTPPFRFDVSFNAGGPSDYTGTGTLTETWLSGQSWRWTVDLGGYSLVRVDSGGLTVEDKHVSQIPMRALMLRNAIFWAMQSPPFQIRTASATWNGKPATCLLLSGMAGPATQTQSRLWEEAEYCIDNASGLLQIHSIAPGTYTVYGYSRDLQFHGRTMPDRITIYVAGAQVVDAQFNITDAGTVDPALLTPTPEMIANGPVIQTMLPSRFPIDVPNPFPSKTIQPVIVHADVDQAGIVLEEELSAASDPALAQAALDLVGKMNLPHAAFAQRQEYINVRFHPTSR